MEGTFCFFDSYLDGRGICFKCPKDCYSLTLGSSECYCESTKSQIFSAEWRRKLEYLLDHDFQYLDNSTIVIRPEEEEEDDGSEYNYITTVNDQYTYILLIILVLCSSCSIIIIITYLLCRRAQQNRQNNPNNVVPQDMPLDEYRIAYNKVKLQTSKKKYEDISQSNNYGISTCVICCDDFIMDDQIRISPCGHIFHSKCIMTWAKSKIWSIRGDRTPDCPNCKRSLIEEESRSIYEV